MTWLDGVLLALLAAVLVVLLLVWRRLRRPAQAPLETALAMLQNQLNDLRNETQRTLSDSQHGLNERLGSVSQGMSELLLNSQENLRRQLGDVRGTLDQRLESGAQSQQEATRLTASRLESTEKTLRAMVDRLASLEEGNRRVLDVGLGLRELQDILRAPKLRGGLGEYFLESLLKEILPEEHVELQYAFRSREKVDAVIKLKGGLLPVDAKFPLENVRKQLAAESDSEAEKFHREFIKDVKKRIDEIAGKYILPAEDTLNLAFMYVPAENVYYEAMLREDSADLLGYALSRRVIPVSPASLYAYLQIVIVGLRGMEVEENAREIVAGILQLNGEFEKLSETFAVLGGHLDKASKAHDKLARQLDGFGRTLASQRALAKGEPAPAPAPTPEE